MANANPTLYPYPRSAEPQSLYLTLKTLIDTLNREAVSGGSDELQAAIDAASAAIAALDTRVDTLEATPLGGVLTAQQAYELSLVTAANDVFGGTAAAVQASQDISEATAEAGLRHLAEYHQIRRDMEGAERFSPQLAFEGSLVTASRTVFGSTAEALENAIQMSEATAEAGLKHLAQTYEAKAAIIDIEQVVRLTDTEALASQVTTLTASLATTNAAVTTEATARATGDAANASAITTVQTQANGNTAAIATIQTSAAGTQFNWGVIANLNGQVTGLIRLDGNQSGTTFTVLADKFIVAKPDGTGVQQMFVLGAVNGVTAAGINGNLLVDGSILARSIAVSELSALTANLGTVTAGLIRNSGDTLRFDLPNMRLYRTDGTMEIDLLNKRIRMTT